MGPRPGRSSAAAEAPPIICAVCLENVAADRVCTPCAHVFCRSCYTDWAAQNATCPTCRTSLVLPSGRVAGLMLEMDAEHAARSGAYQRRVALERRLDEYQASVFTVSGRPYHELPVVSLGELKQIFNQNRREVMATMSASASPLAFAIR